LREVIVFDFTVMSLFRKVVSSNAAQFARASRNVSVKTSVRSLSTVLETREIGEEAKYIRTMEAQRKAEMQAKIDRILALEVGAAERSNLEQLLGKSRLFRRQGTIYYHSNFRIVM
jgi:hypothetical protein